MGYKQHSNLETIEKKIIFAFDVIYSLQSFFLKTFFSDKIAIFEEKAGWLQILFKNMS